MSDKTEFASRSTSTEGEIIIRLNGDELPVAVGASLADLLVRLGKEPTAVAIEYNGVIVPRNRYGEIRLATGDVLEIVHFVQGGASDRDEKAGRNARRNARR